MKKLLLLFAFAYTISMHAMNLEWTPKEQFLQDFDANMKKTKKEIAAWNKALHSEPQPKQGITLVRGSEGYRLKKSPIKSADPKNLHHALINVVEDSDYEKLLTLGDEIAGIHEKTVRGAIIGLAMAKQTIAWNALNNYYPRSDSNFRGDEHKNLIYDYKTSMMILTGLESKWSMRDDLKKIPDFPNSNSDSKESSTESM